MACWVGCGSFPAASRRRGETLEQALEREIREEMAIEVEPGAFLTEVAHAYTHFRITLHAFHAAYAGGEPQHLGVTTTPGSHWPIVDGYAFAVTDRKIIAALRAALGVD